MAGPRNAEEALRFALMDDLGAARAKLHELDEALRRLDAKIYLRHSCETPQETDAYEWTCPTCERTWERHNRGDDLMNALLMNPGAMSFIHGSGVGWIHPCRVSLASRDA